MNVYLLILLFVIGIWILYRIIVSFSSCNNAPIIFLNYNISKYDSVTQTNIEETFFNLVLLREILDNGNRETQDLVIPPVLDSLSASVQKIQPLLEKEKEIVATVKNTTFKLKKDGAGNICFGSPVYFMCLNPKTKELYPYLNDMLVVFHLMQTRTPGSLIRDDHVERLLNTILQNILPCNRGKAFSIDYSKKYDDLLLTKLFNMSELDTDLVSSLMMIILFANANIMLDSLVIENDGTFVVSNNETIDNLQQYNKAIKSNRIPYQQMKHALYNICYATYTLHGFSVMTKDVEKRNQKKQMIDSLLGTSVCSLKSIMKSDNVNTLPKPPKKVTFVDDNEE
jgi:hypothetical protein